MRNLQEIQELLAELDRQPADSLEAQDLDFKEWNKDSLNAAVSLLIEMAICMANGGGGTVVFGVNDKAVGRSAAIIGVPPEIDINRLKKAVYDTTDPKMMPVFEDLSVPEGTGRLLVMQVYSGLPPHTDTSGRGKIRIGKDCQPLTGTLRRRIMVETGETDFTATEVTGTPTEHISAAALEELRLSAQKERAPEELLGLSDIDLLGALGLIRNGKLTRAGLMLAGKESSISEYFPGYVWTHLRMSSDTDYSDRMDGRNALPVALARIMDRIMADNPITTIQHGLFHFEYRTYPEIALREALLNAFCHADYRLSGPVLIKQYGDKIELSNLGGFIGGISPDNILHHPPAARNPLLVEALAKLRLINRSNLGIQRIYSSFLIEGKRPPVIQQIGESVVVTLLRQDMSPAFRGFITEQAELGRILNVDHLLILHHLLEHPEIDMQTAVQICQRDESLIRDILSKMETQFGYLERGGTGRGVYWSLRPAIHSGLAGPGHPERDRRIDWEAAKTRVASILKQRYERGDKSGLPNKEIRSITRFSRQQVSKMMTELRKEMPQIVTEGYGAGAKYYWKTGT